MKEESKHFYEFGPFRVDPDKRLLLRDDRPVPLQPKAFEMLMVLVQNSGTVVLKDDLMKALWPDSFVEESNLTQHVFVLRKSLGETAGENRYIATVPGRGYQFAEKVRLVPDQEEIVVRNHSVTQVVIDAESSSDQIHTVAVGHEQLHPRQVRATHVFGWIGFAGLAVAVLFAGGWYWRSHRTTKLTETDTIVLTDFANSTGDPIFDDTLKTALTVSLRQSPFLNTLSDGRVARILKEMTRPPGTRLTPELARELCQRASSKAYIAGSIGSLGSEYVIGLKAVNCQNGNTLAKEQETASSRQKVLDALGLAATKLRGELGESLATVQRFDVPLGEATTSSLEALEAFIQGTKTAREKGSGAAVPYFQRAIELDPNFAMGYNSVGFAYTALGETGRASEYYTKAFQVREHASEYEKLAICATYYSSVTGELEKSAQTYQDQIKTYPRWWPPYASLGAVFAQQGRYQDAADTTRKALQLAPGTPSLYGNLINFAIALQRFDEARQTIHEARERKLDDVILHNALYTLAFVGEDPGAMAEQQQWLVGKPRYENVGLTLASDTEAYAGHLVKARELTARAVRSAIQTDSKENGAIWQAIAAQREAAYGDTAEARKAAAAALKLAPESPGVAAESALAFAMAGDSTRTESLVQDLKKRFPLDTQMQSVWLPAILAQSALARKDPALAITVARPPSDVELGQIDFAINFSCLDSIYVRGQAYLAAGQSAAAAAEFQKILNHSGIVWNCWTGALAHLGLARANALQAKTSQRQSAEADAARVRALAAYQDFLTLWKDADPEIPILKQAKAEYASLH